MKQEYRDLHGKGMYEGIYLRRTTTPRTSCGQLIKEWNRHWARGRESQIPNVYKQHINGCVPHSSGDIVALLRCEESAIE